MKDFVDGAKPAFTTYDLGQFVAGSGAAPPAVRDRSALMVLDILAATVGALPGKMALSALQSSRVLYPGDEATVWFRGDRLTRIGAVFANASAASALDIDDGHRGAAGHAGAAVVPAALAVAEVVGASGPELLDAIALGYDIALRVAASRRIEHITHYNCGTWGTYGAAAAAGRLLRLSDTEMMQALSIAGVEAPVMLPSRTSTRMGSTVKEGLAWAAVVGLAAVERARAGGTGPEDLLDRPSVYDMEFMTGELGHRWEVTKTYLKPYACCRYIHAAIDAITALRKPGRPIKSLTVEIFPTGLNLGNQIAPHSLEGAQYSYPFSCALAALRGPEALRPVDPASLEDPEVLELSARVNLRAVEEFASDFPDRTPARVTLDQGDGPQVMTVMYPLGDVANPMSVAQVAEKFHTLAQGRVDKARADAVIAAALGLETQGLAPLLSALAGQ